MNTVLYNDTDIYRQYCKINTGGPKVMQPELLSHFPYKENTNI
jgi:hypothetical protein